jgi:hypothetical protein
MLVVLLAHQISSETTLCQYPSLPLLLIQIQIKYYQRRAKHQAMQTVRVLRRPVIRPDVQLLRLAIVAEGGD